LGSLARKEQRASIAHLALFFRRLIFELDVRTPAIRSAGRADTMPHLGLAALAAEIQLCQFDPQMLAAIPLPGP
jgi:hypothetical protein